MSKRIIDALNEDRAYELAAIMQYMGHHYEAEGLESPAIVDIFKSTAMVEMKHAEKLAERIVALGGVPTNMPKKIKRGGDLKTMIGDDIEGEELAIRLYKEHIKLCEEEGDSTTRLLLEEILSDEEGHLDRWRSILGRK